MRKLAVSAVIIGVFAFYSLMHGRANPASPSAVMPRPTTGSSGTPTATDAGGATNPTATSPTATSGPVYKNGTYVGNVADAQWGYVQVKAVIQGGKIANVQWVQYPSDRQRSVEINSYADPQLTTEAIQAQNAQVDIVTGATDSSIAFMESLGNALSQAQA
jgi:uncharacterized protein with FMN-binding domain